MPIAPLVRKEGQAFATFPKGASSMRYLVAFLRFWFPRRGWLLLACAVLAAVWLPPAIKAARELAVRSSLCNELRQHSNQHPVVVVHGPPSPAGFLVRARILNSCRGCGLYPESPSGTSDAGTGKFVLAAFYEVSDWGDLPLFATKTPEGAAIIQDAFLNAQSREWQLEPIVEAQSNDYAYLESLGRPCKGRILAVRSGRADEERFRRLGRRD